jgi:hypothetical protein
MHATMAFVGAGDLERAQTLISDLERFVDQGDRATTGWIMTSTVGLPVCRSIVRFAMGEYSLVVDELLPLRGRFHQFGGSHAQRDAIERTLLEAAIRAGLNDIAQALVSERLSLREANTYTWLRRARILRLAGDLVGSESANARAQNLAVSIRAVQ